MVIKRTIELYKGADYFQQKYPIYVNRSIETFELIEHRHDFLEISYVSEGSGTHHIGDVALTVSQGDIFLIPIGVSHVYRPSSASTNSSLVVYNCVVSKEALEQLMRAFPGSEISRLCLEHKKWKQYQDKNVECYRIFQKLHSEFNMDRHGKETALYLAVIELILYLYRAETEPVSSGQLVSKNMDSILHFLSNNLNTSISQDQMARKFGIGERQFHRLFTKQTGMTLKDYIQTLRVQEACRLLQISNRKINDIATAVGYQDIPFFNKLFKRKTGMSPRDYRNKNNSQK
jgi:AraC family L-rhamnose operon transcriptional activator RhaR